MKKSRYKTRTYSLVDSMKKVIFIAVPIILINILISASSIYNIRQQNHDAICNSVELYQDQLSSRMKAIQHFVQWTVLQDPLLETLESDISVYEEAEAINALRTRVSDNQYATGTEYQYFLYLKEQDAYYNASELNIPWEDYLAIKSYAIDYVNSGTALSCNFTWRNLRLNGHVYLFYLIHYENRAFFSVIDIEDLLEPLSGISLGKKGFLEITDLKNNVLYASKSAGSRKANSFFYSLLKFKGKDYSLPVNIHVYSDNFSNYGQLLVFQIFVIITALGLCIILASFIYYMYRKVIQPIKNFSDVLSNLNEQDELINLQSSNIRELEQTSNQFKNLIREITRLKINIYEQELEQKRFQITFLQNQIRPHFYLNCLTTIGSMAQLGNYRDISSMVLFTSRYLRYLFQTDKDLVRIEYELSHIQAYLDIQSLRYCSTFTYDCQIEKQDEAALIPPLLLITFVENILKHGMNADDDPELTVTLAVKKETVKEEPEHENEMLRIDIIDSGTGFAPEILEKLEHGETLNTTTTSHVGISNSIQRLALLYGTNYSISFCNEASGGAHICLHIPYQIAEETK